MKAFLATLLENLRRLPANLLTGLRPGAGPGSDALARRMRRNFLYHLHPLQVTGQALRAATTLGLGLVSFTLFAVLTVSGVLLMLYYEPTVQGAYASMQDIEYAVTFGSFTRALHRWAAHAMVVCACLHLLRVILTGAYRRRELNWLLGLGLGITTMGLAFTGYLLPWDQRSFWAVNVGANMMDTVPLVGAAFRQLFVGGSQVGPATLLRFYTLHVALLPALLAILFGLHLWRIRRDGGLRASTGHRPTVPAWPHLVLREGILILVVVAILFAVAALVQAPLGGVVDVHTPSNPEKAPWYFLWMQEMVSYSATTGAVVFPGILLVALVVLPFVDREDGCPGRWLGERRARRAFGAGLAVSVVAFAVLTIAFVEDRSGAFFNPASGMLLLSGVTFLATGLWTGSTRSAAQAGLVVMLVAVAGCVLVGLCRGPDWVFYWPWEEWPVVQ